MLLIIYMYVQITSVYDDDLQTKVEMIVTEGDQDGKKIAALVREIGASALVLGLHDHSFLYR